MAELHIIGEITSGHDFGGKKSFCVFELISGNRWTVVEGHTSGCTHIVGQDDGVVTWSFPVDVHYSFTDVQGWPKLSIQVWSIDSYGRKEIAGYGMAFLPMPSMKEEQVEVVTWKPALWHPNVFLRTWKVFQQMVMGGNPVLRDNALIHGSEERFKLHTIGGGTVRLHLSVFSRGMKEEGLSFK